METKIGEISKLKYGKDTKYFRHPPYFGLYRVWSLHGWEYHNMNRFEMLSDFRGEYLVLDVEGLNVDDGCYTWYMSVKDKVADWYNMETGEALCCYKVTRKDELLQDVYLEEVPPN